MVVRPIGGASAVSLSDSLVWAVVLLTLGTWDTRRQSSDLPHELPLNSSG
jgi:hypothetical protein